MKQVVLLLGLRLSPKIGQSTLAAAPALCCLPSCSAAHVGMHNIFKLLSAAARTSELQSIAAKTLLSLQSEFQGEHDVLKASSCCFA